MPKFNSVRPSIVYVYNSYSDPLFKGNLLLILKFIAKKQAKNFYLITYEQDKYRLTGIEESNTKRELASCNIYWHPLRWHSGRFKFAKKIYDLILGLFVIVRLRIFFKCKSIISLGTVSGSFAFIISRLLGLSHYAYQHEPHSEFMLDFHIWSKRSLSFRCLNFFEELIGKNAEIISTGTDAMIERLRKMRSTSQIFKFPSCVDEKRFTFDPEARKFLREKFKVGNKSVILYLGKFGGIYYDQEIIDLFSIFYQLDPSYLFLIVTPDDVKAIHAKLVRAKIPQTNFIITYAQYDQVSGYISASDIGLVAIPPYPSQKYRSPIKVGEYLCCGLPYIVCKGVSEDDIFALKNNVGVALENFTHNEITKLYPKIRDLLTEDKQQQLERCRIAGVRYRGLSQWIATAESIFDSIALK